MFSFLRGPQPPRRPTSHLRKVPYETCDSSQEFHGPDSEYFTTHTLPPAPTPSFFAPPLHYHMSQTETFRVLQGTGRFYLSGKEIMAPVGNLVTIPPCEYHRFESASTDESLVMQIKLSPNRYESEERFFRNFFGYLEDCAAAKTEPSIFQLLLFLDDGDTPLALPLPGVLPRAWRNWVDWGVMKVGGVVVGEWGLGYRRCYEEYYRAKVA